MATQVFFFFNQTFYFLKQFFLLANFTESWSVKGRLNASATRNRPNQSAQTIQACLNVLLFVTSLDVKKTSEPQDSRSFFFFVYETDFFFIFQQRQSPCNIFFLYTTDIFRTKSEKKPDIFRT